MPLPTLQAPPAIVTPIPAPAGQEAENALLEAFDWENALPAPPKLKGAAALSYRWLRIAATFEVERGLPPDPFAGGPDRQEAEALRRLMKAPKDQLATALKTLPLRRSGTALALWRWGRLQVRQGAFEAPLRRLWEDRLIAAGPALTRGYGLRHALCWALAEQDEARLATLRPAPGADSESTFKDFQRLFGLIGGPSPVFRLWTLPGLDYQDLRLDQLGASRIWVCPPPKEALPALSPDTAWVIPSETGYQDAVDASLSAPLMDEGKALAQRLQEAGRNGRFAPSRAAFEKLGLLWFPILIVLNGKGDIQSIRMGDAAPQKP
ncbi:hypothetical protein [Geothrix sp. PMB-07]|uniref:hypothetical protein n=1 Tax=Geothrix sp. PMB-07 TaxID=3068640 RepID=UPI002741AF2E|nr:hypothetical protein [Geothrix sp. PMB-07]WLT32774.1 hypothetical protein Q9293_05435 [Geothrix sp. PMB-07]